MDIPRRILSEKTTLPSSWTSSTRLLRDTLTLFHDELVVIPDTIVKETREEVVALMDYILPRAKKLGNASGLKVRGVIYTGRLFDNTQVIDATEVHVLLVFEKGKVGVVIDVKGDKHYTISSLF